MADNNILLENVYNVLSQEVAALEAENETLRETINNICSTLGIAVPPIATVEEADTIVSLETLEANIINSTNSQKVQIPSGISTSDILTTGNISAGGVVANGNIIGNNISENNKELLDDVVNRISTAKFIKVNNIKEFDNARRNIDSSSVPTIITLDGFPATYYMCLGIYTSPTRGIWICQDKGFNSSGTSLLFGFMDWGNNGLGSLYSVGLTETNYNQGWINQQLAK